MFNRTLSTSPNPRCPTDLLLFYLSSWNVQTKKLPGFSIEITFLFVFNCIEIFQRQNLSTRKRSALKSLPLLFKVARVTPIQKSGFNFNFWNYRPKSALPIPNKVFERAWHSRIWTLYHINVAATRTNLQPMPPFIPSRRVVLHLLVKKTLFQSFLTLIRCFILYVTSKVEFALTV